MLTEGTAQCLAMAYLAQQTWGLPVKGVGCHVEGVMYTRARMPFLLTR